MRGTAGRMGGGGAGEGFSGGGAAMKKKVGPAASGVAVAGARRYLFGHVRSPKAQVGRKGGEACVSSACERETPFGRLED